VSLHSNTVDIKALLGFNLGFICPPTAADHSKGVLLLGPQNASETRPSHTPAAAFGSDLGKIASKAAMDDLHTRRFEGIAAVPDAIRGKVEWLFKGLTPQQKTQLWIDEVAVHSVTQSQIAEQITEITAKALRAAGIVVRDAIVVDAMACVGGNTLSFARTFKTTHAVEISSTRYECLQHNIQVMGLSDQVSVHCGDALAAISAAKECRKVRAAASAAPLAAAAAAASGAGSTRGVSQLPAHVDAVFFDPPWGGPEYAAMPSIDMYVGDMHLGGALQRCAGWAGMAVVKAPLNFNIQGMLERAGGCAKLTQDPVQLRKMQVMTVALQANIAASAVRDPAADAGAPPSAKRARGV